MSKQGFTPGPWRYDGYTDNVIAINPPDDGGDIICTAPSEGGESPSHRRWPNNLALICAAPDLLDALESALDEITYAHSKFIPGGRGEAIAAKARAAIAKAKGEA